MMRSRPAKAPPQMNRMLVVSIWMNSWWGCLRPALGRHRGGGALQDLQQGLLHPFTRDIPGDRRVLALAGDLVDLVDVDDARLGLLDVVVRGLDQLEEDVFHVLADVAGLGQGGGVGDGERHVEHAGQRLGQEGLPAPGRPQEEDVGLLQLDLGVGVPARLDPLVVVVHGDGQDLLGPLLPDDVVVEKGEDLRGLGQLIEVDLRALGQLLLDDVVAQVDALVTDVDAGTGDQLLDLLLRLPAKRALDQVTGLPELGHDAVPPVPLRPRPQLAGRRPVLVW